MQVADFTGLTPQGSRAPIPGNAAHKALLQSAREGQSVSGERLTINIMHVVTQHQLTVQEIKTISPYGLLALDYIASSTRLSKAEKRALIRLVAIVDEFAGGNPKLMRDIIGIAKIMEMNAKKTYPPIPLRDALKIYFEEREKLDPSKRVDINIETEINEVSVQYLGMSVTEVLERQNPENPSLPVVEVTA